MYASDYEDPDDLPEFLRRLSQVLDSNYQLLVVWSLSHVQLLATS